MTPAMIRPNPRKPGQSRLCWNPIQFSAEMSPTPDQIADLKATPLGIVSHVSDKTRLLSHSCQRGATKTGRTVAFSAEVATTSAMTAIRRSIQLNALDTMAPPPENRTGASPSLSTGLAPSPVA
ncbi:hypothetical protein CHELA1G2_11083 [Hyphomicrobiales bacterium]|nr:hypothetical protein CHELA1G2_11083 [Hyphomicrobiales bacterium]